MTSPETAIDIGMIGRSLEKETLRGCFRRVRDAGGLAVLISGDAGIGKTKLLAYLTGLAQSEGFQVVRGECTEQDQSLPFAPLVDALRTYFSTCTADEIETIVTPYQQFVIRLLPELALPSDPPPPAANLEPEADKRRLFEVLVHIFLRIAPSGLLLTVEDAHWSDAASLEFLQTLTRRIRAQRIILAISARANEEYRELAQLQNYLARADNALSIPLAPLADAEVDALIKAALPADSPVHPALMDRLVSLAQGNPLYAEQLVHVLLQRRQIALVNGVWVFTNPSTALEIPGTVRQTMDRQMERLSEPATRVLRYAAVVGRQFDLETLQQLTGFEVPDLTDILKELIRRRVLEEVSEDRFAFRHALLRQAIIDGLLIRERVELHKSILEILEASDAQPGDARLAELSYHAYHAKVWEAALRYGASAGAHALSLHSPNAALEHFSHAVEASGHLSNTVPWALLMQRGRAYESVGELQPALQDYASALLEAERTGNQEQLWQSHMALALYWFALDYGRAEEHCRRALTVAQELEDARLIGHSLNRLGNWYLNTGRPQDALEYHKQALKVFEALDDLPGTAETLDLLGMTTGHVLMLREQHAYYVAAADLFRALDDRTGLASTLANLALCALDVTCAEEAVDLARSIGWYSGEAYACQTAGYVAAAHGHYAQSLSYFRRAEELAQSIDHKQWLAGIQVFSSMVFKDLLELETAAAHAERGLSLAEAVGSHWFAEIGRGVLAQIRIRQGNLHEAEELLAHAATPEPPAMQHVTAMMARAELALARGDPDGAINAVGLLRKAWPPDEDSSASGSFALVPALVIQAQALSMLGRHAEALAALRNAKLVCDKRNLPPLQWRVELAFGRVLAQAEDARAAAACYGRAQALVAALTEELPTQMQSRFLQRATDRIDAARSTESIGAHRPARPGALHTDLTPREMDIAREVGLGKSNKQIAETLHITVKTVETHLTRVYSKLDMDSRTQVALWIAENDQPPYPEPDQG
ncbi:MAG: helix-turn-helix transcriptional regulator [Caldilineaceae bacterium]|jgi:DNA-binding CsgD family transcriptional regulator/tetratricopeptide (TPR) repeat protein